MELRKGSADVAGVKALQYKLNQLEPVEPVPIDGEFGSRTEAKLKRIQASFFASGVLDELTESRIDAAMALLNVSRLPGPMAIDEPRYMRLARTFLGTREISGAADNPVIVEFFTATSYWSTVKQMVSGKDEVAWCAAFRDWVLRKTGYKDANSAAAYDGRKIGVHIPGGARYCVAVWKHLNGSLRGRYHTNFLDEKIYNTTGDVVVGWWCLGGNQSNAVTRAAYLFADHQLVHAGLPEPVLPIDYIQPNPDIPLSTAPPAVKPLVNKGSFKSPDYAYLWATAKVKTGLEPMIKKYADRIRNNRATYEQIGTAVGVPWWVPGLIHYRESGALTLDVYLHNGEKLGRPTTLVPKGIMFRTDQFIEAAIDALKRDKVTGIQTPEDFLLFAERFNGTGYRKKGIYSPYVWSGTQHYTMGKYVSDGVWSPTAIDQQLGVAALLKALT